MLQQHILSAAPSGHQGYYTCTLSSLFFLVDVVQVRISNIEYYIILTLTVLVTTIDALRHFETG